MGNAVIVLPKKAISLHGKSYKIRDPTPDFLIKFRSTLSNFMDFRYKRIFDVESKLDEGMSLFGARQTGNYI